MVALQIESTAASAALLDRATDIAVVDEWGEETWSPWARDGPSAHTAKRSCSPCPDHPVALSHFQKPVSAATLRELVSTETWLSSRPAKSRGSPATLGWRASGPPGYGAGSSTASTSWHGSSPSGPGSPEPSSVAAYERRVARIPLQPRM